jgi:hypothetical protein
MSIALSETPKPVALRDDERQPCEVWTRVMGYHRPVSSFNRGKQGEFRDRVYFDLEQVEVCGHAD